MVGSCIILFTSLRSYSRTGPGVSKAIVSRFRVLAILSIARQWLISSLLLSALAFYSATIVIFLSTLSDTQLSTVAILLFSIGVTGGMVLLRVGTILHNNPAAIAINSNIQSRHWLRLRKLMPRRFIITLEWLLLATATLGALRLLFLTDGFFYSIASLLVILLQLDLLVSYKRKPPVSKTDSSERKTHALPNIIMIGCDTFREDYLGKLTPQGTSLTPNLDQLGKQAVRYTNMVTPIARTAPSLASLFCSQWPNETKLWDNFTDPDTVNLKSQIRFLKGMGYRTATYSDWAGSDFARYDYGFDEHNTPPDQWNIRYLLRQGTKQYRLFLSLFSSGRIGLSLLPEIHFAAGVPQNEQATYRFCEAINRYSQEESPFLLNLFLSTAHPPFGSEAPYYDLYSKAETTQSPFCMVKLTEPEDIIKSQKDPRLAFDLDQILSLYEGCITNFDRRVGDIIDQLKQSDLYDDCAVVIYSDHGIDFFENDSWGQGNNLDGLFSNRVPCIIKTPENIGKIDHTYCANLSVFPSLFRHLGIPVTQSRPLRSQPSENCSSPTDDMAASALFLETGVWLTRPPSADVNHLFYPDIDLLLDVPDHQSGRIVLADHCLQKIVAAKDRAVIQYPWILVAKPFEDGLHWFLYNLQSDPLMKADCLTDFCETANQLKSIYTSHFEGEK